MPSIHRTPRRRPGARAALAAVAAMAGLLPGLAGPHLPAAAGPLPGPTPPSRQVTSFRVSSVDSGRALFRQSDGVVLAVGAAGGDFGLVRFNGPLASADASFSIDGVVTTDFWGRDDVATSAAEVPGTALVVAGSSSGDMAVARYDMDGVLDRGFGREGRRTVDLGGGDDAGNGIVVQAGGRAVVAGGNASGMVAVRLGPDGALDPTFGDKGRAALPVATPARAIVAQPDGKLILVAASGANVAVVRIDADGRPDPGFGTSGVTLVPLGTGAAANAVALLADGRIVVAGGTGGDVALVRLLPTGSPDATFGRAGVVTSNLGGTETAFGMLIGEDARVHVVGSSTPGRGFMATYLPTGALDPSFGTGGSLATEPLRAISASPLYTPGTGNRWMLLGTRTDDFFVRGFHWTDSDGFNHDLGAPIQKALAATRMADGRTVVAGETGGEAGIARHRPDGSLDPSFGLGGRVVTDMVSTARGVGVESGGRVVVAGTYRGQLAFVGLRPDGSVDSAFGTAGRAVLPNVSGMVGAMLVLPDNSLLVTGGGSEEPNGGWIARLSADGIPDLSFGEGGVKRAAFPGHAGPPQRLVRQPDGKLLIAASEYGVTRLNADLTLDPSFGQGGTAGIDPADFATWKGVATVALQPDGRILVGGNNPWGSTDFGVVRLNADGSKDTTWAVAQPTYRHPPWDRVLALFVRPDGTVVAAGAKFVARYRANGNLDGDFVEGGSFEPDLPVDHMVEGFLSADGVLRRVGSQDLRGGFVLATDPLPATRGRFHALTPSRILDTRLGLGAPAARMGKQDFLDVQVTGRGGVPATGVAAVVLNVTAVDPAVAGHLLVYRAGTSPPLASSLNVRAGQTQANLVVVAVGTGGRVGVYASAGSVHVVADVAGWFGDGFDSGGDLFHAATPSRILDTRLGNGAPASKVPAGSTLELQVTGRGGIPATGVRAVVMNVTAVDPSAGGYVTAWPTGEPRPGTSNLNVPAGRTVPNLVVVPIGAAGRVSLFSGAGAVHLLADVSGWFGDGADGLLFHPLSGRACDTRSNIACSETAGPLVGGAVRDVITKGVPNVGVRAVVLNVTAVDPTTAGHITVWPAGQPRPETSNLNFVAGQTTPNLVFTPVSAGLRVSAYTPSGSVHLVVDHAGWFSAP